jgi:hypothetical protein
MNDDAKRANRQHDRSHETMPPELRPFVKPAPPQRLVAPEDEPEFNAAILALKMINGGPEADPFYVDPKAEAAAEAKPQAAQSVKVYAPPIAVSVGRGAAATPQNETGYVDTRALQAMRGAKGTATPILVSVKSAADVSATRGQRHATEDGHEPGAIDIRPFKAALAAHEAATRREAEAAAAKAEEDETTLQQAQIAGTGPANSPWAKDAELAPIALVNLPSSLAPGATSEPGPQSEQPAGVPVGGNTRVRIIGVLALLIVLGFAVVLLMPKRQPQEALAPVPVRSAGPAVAPPTASGTVVAPPSASAAVPPPGPTAMVEVDAGASVAPNAPAAPGKPRTKIDDPYDAAAPVPGPAKTVEAVVPAPLPTVAPVATTPHAPSTVLPGGEKLEF